MIRERRNGFRTALAVLTLILAGTGGSRSAFAQEPHTHTWSSSYTVDQEPTCTRKGKKSIHCTECGKRQPGSIVKIDPLGHDWTDWEVTVQPDVFTKGAKERSCSRCGKTQTRTVPKEKKVLQVSCDTLTLTKGEVSDALWITGTGAGDSLKEAVCKKGNVQVEILNRKRGTLRLTAVKKGRATVSLMLESGKKKSVKVIVLPLATKRIRVTPSVLTLSADKKSDTRIAWLSAALSPSESDEKIRWQSADPTVARVTQKGKVTAVKPGTTQVEATSGEASCRVTVTVTE